MDRRSLAYRCIEPFGPYWPGETFSAESLAEDYAARLIAEGVIEEVRDEPAASAAPVAAESAPPPSLPRPAFVLDLPVEASE